MNVKQVIVVRRDLNMRKGKIAAQVAHASMQFLLHRNFSSDPTVLVRTFNQAEYLWLSGLFTKVVAGVDSEEELRDLINQAKAHEVMVYEITDSGRTEFRGKPTLTCAAFGPDTSDRLDQITGHLKLI